MQMFRILSICVVFLFLLAISGYAQSLHTSVIGASYVGDATAFSNGFKIVPLPAREDTLFAVYGYNTDSCYYAISSDRGVTWEAHPLMVPGSGWENAHHPSCDVYRSGLIVVYESDSAGNSEIFVENPFDRCIPQRISHTAGNSILPAIVVDRDGGIHIVWQEDTPGNSEIYYYFASSYCPPADSETINLSCTETIYDRYPSISIYNGDEVHVIWERDDPPCETPYSIAHRYLRDGVWSGLELLDYDWHPLHHASLDYCHGEDSLSAAWEHSDSAIFYGGNGGGFPTTGESRYPVVSTVGYTWSYLYWEDNSDGYDDILAHLYYSMSGWSSYKFRDYCDEKVRYPNTSGCYVIWTQGDSAPYEVMFSCEDYPIGVEEDKDLPQCFAINCFPNPFNSSCVITAPAGAEIEIYDLRGTLRLRSVPDAPVIEPAEMTATRTFIWTPDETIASGIYLVRVRTEDGQQMTKRIVLVK